MVIFRSITLPFQKLDVFQVFFEVNDNFLSSISAEFLNPVFSSFRCEYFCIIQGHKMCQFKSDFCLFERSYLFRQR